VKEAEPKSTIARKEEWVADSYLHVSGMLDRTGLDWLLVMFDFEIYFDDSGTHAESPIAVAACYVSSKTQWDHFNRNWSDVLKDEGFEYFHMADFMLNPKKGHKPYCDWDSDKKERVYRKLASIIRLRTRCEFAVSVPKDIYDKHASDDMKKNYAKDHYAFAVKCCLGLIWRWRMDFNVTAPMQYIFDSVPKGLGRKGQIMQIWQEIDADPEAETKFGLSRRDGYQFQDKKIFKPLQAADILAWHMYDHMEHVVSKGLDDIKAMRKSFMPLRDGREAKLAWFTKSQLESYLEGLRELEKKSGMQVYGVQHVKQRIRKDVGTDRQIADSSTRRDQSEVAGGKTSEKAGEI